MVDRASYFSVDTKNQLVVTFCILYFSSNSCSTCFGQPCAHHQELTTAWCYSLVLVCGVATNPSMDALTTKRTWPTSCSHATYQHKAITSRSRQLLMMGTWLPETCWATIKREIKNTKVTSSWVFLSTYKMQLWKLAVRYVNYSWHGASKG